MTNEKRYETIKKTTTEIDQIQLPVETYTIIIPVLTLVQNWLEKNAYKWKLIEVVNIDQESSSLPMARHWESPRGDIYGSGVALEIFVALKKDLPTLPEGSCELAVVTNNNMAVL